MPNYAVVITYSFDSQVSVLLFETWEEAFNFIKNDVESEMRIDVEENGWDSEYVISENEGRATLTTHWNDGDDIVEWKIGTVYDPHDLEDDDCEVE